MLEHAGTAFFALMEPMRLLALFGGMAGGIVFGMLPGLGGVAAVSILLPFIYLVDPFSGLAMLLGATSTVYTSDTITSVLVGAPGSPASAPTAIEGHALAKQGEAARALGVGFLASMVGGIIGAIVLLFAIPIAGPIVLMLGTPELLMFALVGLYFASSMVSKNLAKGLAAACLGILLGVVGAAPAAVNYRFTFEQAYLLDGLSLTVVALGLFGIPEVVAMLSSGGGISGERTRLTRWNAGFSDFWRNRWLILRCSVIGVFGGFVPAVGASASTWVAYGHAITSTRDKSKFGHGEIRGIAAAEGANNATIIADLVPTLLFSVPGGPAAAIFLGALFSLGYYPGPRMVSENPDLMFLIVWSVALASVMGAAICFMITPAIARLTQIRFALIAAPLLLVMVLGAYQSTSSMGDIFVLMTLGVVGWLMKHGGWPRAPALVGFVLAKPMEQYFWLTNQLHGWTWLMRPGVIIIALFIIIPLVLQLYQWQRGETGARATAPADGAPLSPPAPVGNPTRPGLALILAGIMALVFSYALWEFLGFSPGSQLLSGLAIIPGVALVAFLLFQDGRKYRRSVSIARTGESFTEPRYILALLLYVALVWIIGFNLATLALLAWILLACARMRILTGALYGLVILVAIHGLFFLMKLTPPEGILINVI